jgi:hypothetical protein
MRDVVCCGDIMQEPRVIRAAFDGARRTPSTAHQPHFRDLSLSSRKRTISIVD